VGKIYFVLISTSINIFTLQKEVSMSLKQPLNFLIIFLISINIFVLQKEEVIMSLKQQFKLFNKLSTQFSIRNFYF